MGNIRNGIKEKIQTQRISDSMLPRLLSVKQAAEYLGLTVWAMREAIWRGDIPVVKFPNGRKQFIDTQDIEDFISRNKSVVR